MPGHGLRRRGTSVRSADCGRPGRFLLSQRQQEGLAQAFELRSQTHRVCAAFGRQLVRADAAPLQAQLEQRGGA